MTTTKGERNLFKMSADETPKRIVRKITHTDYFKLCTFLTEKKLWVETVPVEILVEQIPKMLGFFASESSIRSAMQATGIIPYKRPSKKRSRTRAKLDALTAFVAAWAAKAGMPLSPELQIILAKEKQEKTPTENINPTAKP